MLDGCLADHLHADARAGAGDVGVVAYLKSENSIINATNVKMNGDGAFTVRVGSKEICGDVPNKLDVSEGWNIRMRVYLPAQSVVDGTYKLLQQHAAPIRKQSTDIKRPRLLRAVWRQYYK